MEQVSYNTGDTSTDNNMDIDEYPDPYHDFTEATPKHGKYH